MTTTTPTAPDGRAAPRFGAGAALGMTFAFGTLAGWLTLDHHAAAKAEVLLAIVMNILVLSFAIALEGSRRPYSMHMMHLVALFLFLGAPALYQYSVGRFAVAGPIQSMRPHLLPSALVVSLWILGYVASYEFSSQLARVRRGPVLRLLDRPVDPGRTFLVLALALASILYLGALGLVGVATRLGADDAFYQSDVIRESLTGAGLVFYLIHAMLLRGLSVVALLAGVLLVASDRRARNPIFLAFLGVVAVGTLLANNPFAASRMWFATFAIAFFAPLVLRRMRSGWGLALIAVAGLTLLPALNENRHSETFDDLLDVFVIVSPVDYLARSSDVDSLGMLSLCHQWTTQFGHRFGLQELGAVLFWFPRVIWRDKPIETGRMVTEDLGFEFTNLAPPIMSEAFVDFGFLGVPFVAAFVGFVFSRLDRGYWERAPGDSGMRVIDAIYPIWLGCVIFLTRGGLFASLTFTTAFTFWILPFVVGVRQRGAARSPASDWAAVNR